MTPVRRAGAGRIVRDAWGGRKHLDIFASLERFPRPEVAYVVGAGPNRGGMLPPEGSTSIALNRVIEIDYPWTYWMCFDQNSNRFDWYHLPKRDGTIYLMGRAFEDQRADYIFSFSGRINGHRTLLNGVLLNGATVAGAAIQFLHYIGCRDIRLIGCDFSGELDYAGEKTSAQKSTWTQIGSMQKLLGELRRCGTMVSSLTETQIKLPESSMATKKTSARGTQYLNGNKQLIQDEIPPAKIEAQLDGAVAFEESQMPIRNARRTRTGSITRKNKPMPPVVHQGPLTGMHFPVPNIDFEKVLLYKDMLKDSEDILLVGAGHSGKHWQDHCGSKTYVVACNSTIRQLRHRADAFLCTEGNGCDLPWFWTEGTFDRFVSYCNLKEPNRKPTHPDMPNTIAIERGWHIAGFDPREYLCRNHIPNERWNDRLRNPYMKWRSMIGVDRIYHREWGLLKGPVCYGRMSIGTVFVNGLHLLAFMGAKSVRTIGFDFCQKEGVDHWTEHDFKYVPTRWSPPECFINVLGHPALWHFALSAAFAESLRPKFEAAGFTWKDYSKGLMNIPGIAGIVRLVGSEPRDIGEQHLLKGEDALGEIDIARDSIEEDRVFPVEAVAPVEQPADTE